MTNAHSNTSTTHAEVFAAARELVAADQMALQRIRRREAWELARERAEILTGKTDRQAILDVLHDDAQQLDVGRWFATLPACEQREGCTYPATTDPWDRPPTHAASCARGLAIAARWGHL